MNARKTRLIFVSAIVTLLFLCPIAQARRQSRVFAEELRVARLAGLTKVWGAVNFFHPFLPSERIDWDRALIETISKVDAAKSSEEYAEAINSMLARLDDERHTRAAIRVKSNIIEQTKLAEPFRATDGILTIDLIAINERVAAAPAAMQTILQKTTAQLPQAKAIILDSRAVNRLNFEKERNFASILNQIIEQVTDKPITTGALRYRMHSGYKPQSGRSSGGFYSAMMQTAPEILGGESISPMPPMIVLYNNFTPPSEEVFGNLQLTGKVLLVREGAQTKPETGGSTFEMKLPGGVVAKLRTGISLYADGSTVNLQPGVIAEKSPTEDAAMNEALKNIRNETFTRARNKPTESLPVMVDDKDKSYAEMEFPAKEYRLLALFRYWNVINYFFAYKDLIGSDWNDVLPKYIPKFETNVNAVGYQMTVREMAAEMRDSHGTVENAKALNNSLGGFDPPVVLRHIENQTVVFKVLDDQLPLQPGDVVLAIDGEEINKRREFYARFTAAPTPQSLMRMIHYSLLRGQKDTTAKLTVRASDGKVRTVEILRTIDCTSPEWAAAGNRSTPVVAILPSGFGYVDLTRFQRAEVDRTFDTIKSTPAAIFDMRG